ncbi:MAG: MCE family protein [Alphaproteobacteria bacterium]|nr:MCE family protein [Alphaproteobacteria bacterium]
MDAALNGFARGEAKEILAGLAALVLLGAIFFFSVLGQGLGRVASTELIARFSRADGITLKSEVRISGVRVGRVVGQSLDEYSRVVLTLGLDPGVKLDTQASASIATDGLFGAKHVEIKLGGGDADIPSGEEIAYTEPAMLIEDLLELILSRAREARAKPKPGEKDAPQRP